jgi:hypothetical protein
LSFKKRSSEKKIPNLSGFFFRKKIIESATKKNHNSAKKRKASLDYCPCPRSSEFSS